MKHSLPATIARESQDAWRRADPNLDPNELGQNAKIASNGLVYRPPSDAILQCYMDKFAKKMHVVK